MAPWKWVLCIKSMNTGSLQGGMRGINNTLLYFYVDSVCCYHQFELIWEQRAEGLKFSPPVIWIFFHSYNIVFYLLGTCTKCSCCVHWWGIWSLSCWACWGKIFMYTLASIFLFLFYFRWFYTFLCCHSYQVNI